eukprot:2081514-Pleurochrysis_carterae.AAC.1
MFENLNSIWIPVEDAEKKAIWLGDVGQGNRDNKSKRSRDKAGASAGEKAVAESGEGAAMDDGGAEADETGADAKVREIDLGGVLEHELKVAGVSAKRGYDELVCEAVAALLGEASVGTHAGPCGSADERMWCVAECPGCQRDLTILVVCGLDVVQCGYCSHWSFTNPPFLEHPSGETRERN